VTFCKRFKQITTIVYADQFPTLFGKIGNVKRDLSVSFFDANLYGLLAPLPFVDLYCCGRRRYFSFVVVAKCRTGEVRGRSSKPMRL